MSWLEHTRTAALALRGTEQASPVRPRARRSQF
ncbi:PE-PGRS family protein OS=Kitasatospora aureofaciens OX=1894 GN=GCM10010502_68730 PE=4 SV=1 [Kitasatospora aureofaciens]